MTEPKINSWNYNNKQYKVNRNNDGWLSQKLVSETSISNNIDIWPHW